MFKGQESEAKFVRQYFYTEKLTGRNGGRERPYLSSELCSI